jgi:hypothetical protein
VYISNCTIWVEGITDKLYIQKFISEYLKSVEGDNKYSVCKQFKEGLNYSFALTSGDSIIHWDFSDDGEYYENTKKVLVRKLCSKSLVIVDNDFGKNSERKRLLQEVLKERFIELDLPEIENLLSIEVVVNTVKSYPSVLKALEKNPLPVVRVDDFRSNKIGYFIDGLLLKDFSSVKKFSTSDGTGSLKTSDKFTFCNKALEFIKADNLTDESKILTEQILDFILSRNAFL